MYPYTPLWKRGARGDFISIILKSPFIPLCQREIKTSITEGLLIKNLYNFLKMLLNNTGFGSSGGLKGLCGRGG